jgi:flagellar motor switch/type III secretory pathway protein FliN
LTTDIEKNTWISSIRPIAEPATTTSVFLSYLQQRGPELATDLSAALKTDVAFKSATQSDLSQNTASASQPSLTFSHTNYADNPRLYLDADSIKVIAHVFYGTSIDSLRRTGTDSALKPLDYRLARIGLEGIGLNISDAIATIAEKPSEHIFCAPSPPNSKQSCSNFVLTFDAKGNTLRAHLDIPSAWFNRRTDTPEAQTSAAIAWQSEMAAFVEQSEFLLVASVGGLPTTLEAVSTLRIGSVVPLPSRSHDVVDLSVLDELLFHGQLGRLNDQLSIRLSG